MESAAVVASSCRCLCNDACACRKRGFVTRNERTNGARYTADTAKVAANVPGTLPGATALAQLANELEESTPQEILAWAIATYGDRVTLACSFGGPSGMVLLDMALQIKPDIPVFYVDTGFLFSETYALVERVAARYHIAPQALQTALTPAAQATQYGEALWSRNPDQCCDLRKVAPQRDYLKNYDAWITGLRRDQASTRRVTPVVQWDSKFGLAKVSPLVRWGEREVWNYIVTNDVPYNPLHDQNYPSIGCTHCTRAVAPGEDMRAGRWSGFQKVECGIHLPESANATPPQKAAKGESVTEQQQQPASPETTGRELLTLGPGAGSKVERIKASSDYLRGDIVAQLEQPNDAFQRRSDSTAQVSWHLSAR